MISNTGTFGASHLSSGQFTQMVPYSQPVHDLSYQPTFPVSSNEQPMQQQLQAQLMYLYQKQQESQQMYNQLGQNIQQLFQQNFNQFGNRFFEQQNSILGNQQQQTMLQQQDHLKQQMQYYNQQQQMVQQQLQQQYDTHSNRLLEYQQQNNQQLVTNIQNQNTQFQTQQAQYTQQVNQQYQQTLSSFKQYLESILSANTDTIFNKFFACYQQMQSCLENKLEEVSREITFTNTTESNVIRELQTEQQNLSHNIDTLKNISTFVQKDINLLCRTQIDLFNTFVEGNIVGNQQQCDILNYCFKDIMSKLTHLENTNVESMVSDNNNMSQYMSFLKTNMKDVQRAITATVDSIVLSRFDRFEQQFNKKVEDLSSLLTLTDQKISSAQLQDTLHKRQSVSPGIKQQSPPGFINDNVMQQPQTFQQQPIYPSPSFQVAQLNHSSNAIQHSSVPQSLSSVIASMPPPATYTITPTYQVNQLSNQAYPQPSARQYNSQFLQVPQMAPPNPPPPPNLPFMAQQPQPIPHSSPNLPQSSGIQQVAQSVCTDVFCQDPSCTTLTRKHDHVPQYNGSTPLNYWLRRLDREIQACGYTDHQAFLLAQSKLFGDALFWIDQNDNKFLTYQHPTISSLNKYSFQLLKPALAKKFTKTFEDFFEDLDKIRQQSGQTYKKYMRKLQVESQHGSISMRYLKQVFVRNILNRQVALHLSHYINDESMDLHQLANKAVSIDRELSRSRSVYRSSRTTRFRSQSSNGSRGSFGSQRSRSQQSLMSGSNSSSYYIPSRSASPASRRSASPSSSTSSRYNPRFKRYKSPSDRPRFKDKEIPQRDRKMQHVSLSSGTSISRPKVASVRSSSIINSTSPPPQFSSPPPPPPQQQSSNMVSQKQQSTSNKDVTNFSIRETLNNLKLQISLPTLLHNSTSHLSSFYDFVSDFDKPTHDQNFLQPNVQHVQYMTQGTKTRITACRVDTMKCLNVLIKNLPIQAILDSGSQPSLINVSICNQLGYTQFKSCNIDYSMVNQTTFKPLGILSVPIQLSDTLEVLLDLVVVSDCGFQLLLGLDFINSTCLIQYPTKVQVKNPQSKRYMDLPIIETILDTPHSHYLSPLPHIQYQTQFLTYIQFILSFLLLFVLISLNFPNLILFFYSLIIYYLFSQPFNSFISYFNYFFKQSQFLLLHNYSLFNYSLLFSQFLSLDPCLVLFFTLFFIIIFFIIIIYYCILFYFTSFPQNSYSLIRVKNKKLRQCTQVPIQKVRIPKHQKFNLKYILYPNFPQTKYNLILCDAPWQYQSLNALSPSYRTLSYSQLKSLPVHQIAAQDCVFLYWSTGPMLDKSLNLCKLYGFKHLTVYHVWRKLGPNKTTYKSRTHTATLTQPNMEFLIIGFRGNYKKLLHKQFQHISQDLPSHVQPHSQKPQYVYKSIASIFNVFSFPCIELFARHDTHPYFDLYGDQVPNYFQPSQKILSSSTHLSKHHGHVMSITQQSSASNPNVQPFLQNFPSSIHTQLCTLLQNCPFIGSQLFKCMKLLSRFLHIFAWSTAVGRMTNIKHSIRLLPNAQPKAFVPYRLSQVDRLFVEQEINELLRLGYIVRCASPWAAPVIVVPKEGGKRMVVDFRYLNSQTVKEHWPLPNFSDFLSYLSSARYFSKIDLKSGFFNQLYASPQDEELTSFVCHLGQFKTTRLWFGLCNAPSSFQRAITDALGSLVFKCVLVYIDDILIFSNSFDQHLIDLTNVLQSLEKANVKLHPTKCSLFNTKIDFLSHTIFDGKLTPKLKRFSLLQHMTAPNTKTQVKCFLGLISYYRRFLSNFSSIAKPLTDLLQKDIPFSWTSIHQIAFDQLRTHLLALPTLHLPTSDRVFVLNTDYSSKGIGAVLQQQDTAGTLYPIEFISRTLNKHEKNYGSYEGETLAVIFALSRFRHYLLGQHFILQTDNHALQQVLKNKSNSPKLHRWLLQLSEFNFSVIHKKGSENSHADALSRLAPLHTNSSQVFYNRRSFRKVRFLLRPQIKFFKTNSIPRLHKRYTRQSKQFFIQPFKLKSILRRTPYIFNLSQQNDQQTQLTLPYQPIDLPDIPCEACNSTDDAPDMYICEFCGKGFHSFCFPPCPIVVPKEFYYCNPCISQIQHLHKKDPILDFKLLQFVKTQKFPTYMPQKQRQLIQQRSHRYSYNNGTYFIIVNTQKRILPTLLARQQLLFEYHDNTSHPGSYKTVSLIMQKYFWPSLRRDVRKHIKYCSLCICKRAEYRDSESLQPLPKGNRPFQYWHIDLLTDLPPTREDFKHILVCICSFSKWIELVPLKNRSALEISHGFYRDVICRYGSPLTVVFDNGMEFSGEFTTLLSYINCHQKFINPNRPRSNGQAERFVQTTTHLLRSTLHSNNIALNDWVTALPTVLYTLRMSASVHPTSPFQVIHGFLPNLISPLNTTINIKDTASSNNSLQQYVDTLGSFQQNAFKKTAQRLQQQFDKGDYYYRQKSTKFPYSFKINDLVFKSAGRTSKLQLKSEGPFIIVSFKNPTTVILRDPSNNTTAQSSVYNLVPIPVMKNIESSSIQYEPQPLIVHKRNDIKPKRKYTKRQ